MAEIQLGVIEARYADMIWEREPVTSSELVKLTAEAFHWKRTTAHNVLRRLCDKGLFQNDNGTVTARVSRQEFYARQSKQFVDVRLEQRLSAGQRHVVNAGVENLLYNLLCGHLAVRRVR